VQYLSCGDRGSDGSGGGGGDDSPVCGDCRRSRCDRGLFVRGMDLLVRDDVRNAIPVNGGLAGVGGG